MFENVLQSILYDECFGDFRSADVDPDLDTYREYLRTNPPAKSSRKSISVVPRKVRNAWWSMRSRCNDQKSDKYEYYGGRGICVIFKSCEEFYKEIGDPPSPQHTVDRTNNDGHYAPGNVRWATRSEQQRNKRPFEQWPHGRRMTHTADPQGRGRG